MDNTFAAELVRRIAPVLRGELAIQSALPLEIKLHLERLKLMEQIRASNEKDARSTDESQPAS
jgi:hypothetical protein